MTLNDEDGPVPPFPTISALHAAYASGLGPERVGGFRRAFPHPSTRHLYPCLGIPSEADERAHTEASGEPAPDVPLVSGPFEWASLTVDGARVDHPTEGSIELNATSTWLLLQPEAEPAALAHALAAQFSMSVDEARGHVFRGRVALLWAGLLRCPAA